ncbi:Uncharacterised protein [Mycobacterium tuberculosis]|nr:Uncharacterised protein [Mycobacterium tuberculosis]
MFSQTHSAVVRSVTTDNNYTFNSVFFQLLNPFKLPFKLSELWITS